MVGRARRLVDPERRAYPARQDGAHVGTRAVASEHAALSRAPGGAGTGADLRRRDVDVRAHPRGARRSLHDPLAGSLAPGFHARPLVEAGGIRSATAGAVRALSRERRAW